jgi:hypothetical protein
MRPLLALALPVLLLGPLAGCGGKRIPAVGPAYEIVVLAPRGKAVLAEEVGKVLGEEIETIRFEPRFKIQQDVLEDYRFYTTRKILFVVGSADDPAFEKYLKKATGTRTRTDFPGLWIETEPFSAGQIAFVLTGDPQEIVRNVHERREQLIDVVEDATVTLILTNIFRPGERPGARQAMLERWGWGLRLPPEWVIEDRSSDETRFVRIWRDAPVAQIFVSWEDGMVDRTPEEWLERRHELGWIHYDQDQVVWDRSEAVATDETFFGPPGVFLKGLWKNDKYVIGGPFEAWAFQCPEDDRTYFVDLSVYAPDRDKLPLQRVLRAVARTFRCGCVPPPPAGSPS